MLLTGWSETFAVFSGRVSVKLFWCRYDWGNKLVSNACKIKYQGEVNWDISLYFLKYKTVLH